MGQRVKYLVIHCTATPKGRPVSSADIRRWHTDPVAKGGRGWKRVGYRAMIHLDGTIEQLVANNDDGIVDSWEVTNGASGINSVSEHIVYVGGGTDSRGEDTRTPGQLKSLESEVKRVIKRSPKIKVAGHNQFAAKSCPSFDVPAWLRSIGVSEDNIYKPA
jgi:N-acetylmuramoyl-L-alanine amidase